MAASLVLLPHSSKTLSISSPNIISHYYYDSPPSMVTFVDATQKHRRRLRCRAMVQQDVPQRPSATQGREQERLSAKQSLLLAIKDAGGFEAILTGKTSDIQKIDVNERIASLESLNPTPRPTASPLLESRWNFELFGSGSPGFFAAKVILERSPSTFANLSNMDVYIKDGYAKITANVKLLNSLGIKIIVSSKLLIEGPLRMKEEFSEAIFEPPTVIEETVPHQVKSVYGQAVNVVQKFPFPVMEAASSGMRFPLNGIYQRLFMISYLDEDILIRRDSTGVPEVLSRLNIDPPSSTPKEHTDTES